MFKDNTLVQYIEQLASRTPTPGGGSAAALAGCLGAALISMAANFTTGERYKEVEEDVHDVLKSAKSLMDKLIPLIDEDSISYRKVQSAYKLPKETTDEKDKRSIAIQEALKENIGVSMDICRHSYTAAALCDVLTDKGNPMLLGDVASGIVMLWAAFQSSLLNVETNLKNVKDERFIIEARRSIEPMAREIEKIRGSIMEKVRKKLSIV
jgi:glutamate formiminotransferase/formiminotetrahydrofolate cyclodeaminase